MEDICPSRDMAQSHIYENGRCKLCLTLKTAYYCECGHLGDAPMTSHCDTWQAGHGACKICNCNKYTWTNKKEGNSYGS